MALKMIDLIVKKVDEEDNSVNGSMSYIVECELNGKKREYDVQYRITVEFMRSAKEMPIDYISTMIESKAINELNLEGIEYSGVNVVWEA